MLAIKLEDKEKIIYNNKKISELLTENEQILKCAGFNLPVDNFAFDPENERGYRIQVPTGYIRTKDYYIKEYDLSKICGEDSVHVPNIAYSLEVSDFYNYILNRFGIYGPILSMMYKHATINIVSIIEVLMKAYIKTLQQKCMACPKKEECDGRIVNRYIKPKFKEQVDKYKNLRIFGWDDSMYDKIKRMYDYRNRVHISKATENELTDRIHSRDQYNDAIALMKEINTAMKAQIESITQDENCIRYCA